MAITSQGAYVQALSALKHRLITLEREEANAHMAWIKRYSDSDSDATLQAWTDAIIRSNDTKQAIHLLETIIKETLQTVAER